MLNWMHVVLCRMLDQRDVRSARIDSAGDDCAKNIRTGPDIHESHPRGVHLILLEQCHRELINQRANRPGTYGFSLEVLQPNNLGLRTEECQTRQQRPAGQYLDRCPAFDRWKRLAES